LVLRLGDEKFVFVISEKLTFLCIEVDVVTVYPGGIGGNVPIAALDTDLDIVVLKRHEGEHLGPVFTEEERDHVVITCIISLFDVGCDRQ